ncbi:putative disease resistance protein [Camellia lanceoleosa]|uniref:Disease resistance protein n=1 Tax=Camellia lanceoleosa TaxID=1840588 RepID=A0ACC0IJH8_9ERIC|nr:putative disease resistance protein [Camellia lanceoleosa]
MYRLNISNCPKLRKLPGFFGDLRVLKIKKCDSLKALPVTPFLVFLILIDNLAFEGWSEPRILLYPSNDQDHPLRCISGSSQFQHDQYRLVLSSSGYLTLMQHKMIHLLELKIVGCPMIQGLPQFFSPQKLELIGCNDLLQALPIHTPRHQVLALDTCPDATLVQAIPHSPIMYSLAISNISNLVSLPALPELPQLSALHIRGCKDLKSLLDREGSWQSLPNLKLLSIRDCSQLSTLADEGLPVSLECLIIHSCANLRSLGPSWVLRNLSSLKDLYIDDCPELESLPEDGVHTSLQHLHIKGCPLLTVQCKNEDGGGSDWQKIRDIPDLQIEKVALKPRASSSACSYFPYCCKGIDTKDTEQVEQLKPGSLKKQGQNSKGKMEPGGSNSAENRLELKGKAVKDQREKPLSSIDHEHGQNFKGKTLLGQSSSSTEQELTDQSSLNRSDACSIHEIVELKPENETDTQLKMETMLSKMNSFCEVIDLEQENSPSPTLNTVKKLELNPIVAPNSKALTDKPSFMQQSQTSPLLTEQLTDGPSVGENNPDHLQAPVDSMPNEDDGVEDPFANPANNLDLIKYEQSELTKVNRTIHSVLHLSLSDALSSLGQNEILSAMEKLIKSPNLWEDQKAILRHLRQFFSRISSEYESCKSQIQEADKFFQDRETLINSLMTVDDTTLEANISDYERETSMWEKKKQLANDKLVAVNRQWQSFKDSANQFL